MIWNPEQETMDRAALERLQLERLQSVVARVYDRVPLYRQRLDAAGVKPGDVRRPDDVERLP